MKLWIRRWKSLLIYFLVPLIFISDIYMLREMKKQSTRRALNPERYNFKVITSIQYQEIKETAGEGDGRRLSNTTISYVYPDKLRIEAEGKGKKVEIYNNNRYICYESLTNKIIIKECFPPEKPYITEIEKRMQEIFNSGDYEFLGYEEIDDRRAEVIGIKSKIDGYSYMHKLWMADINKITLPIKEQYFINNTAVSRTSYNYLSVNQPISPEIFNVTSLPKADVIEGGVIPKFFDSMGKAGKYLKFELVKPVKLPEGFKVTEIAVLPPVKNPSFQCVFFKEDLRIYLSEKKSPVDIRSNKTLGTYPCEFIRDDERISISWKQEGVYIMLSGDENGEVELVNLAEEMVGGVLK